MHFLEERFHSSYELPKGVHDIFFFKLSTAGLKGEYKVEEMEWERHTGKKQHRGIEERERGKRWIPSAMRKE